MRLRSVVLNGSYQGADSRNVGNTLKSGALAPQLGARLNSRIDAETSNLKSSTERT